MRSPLGGFAAQAILNRIASSERVGAQESMKFEILRVWTFRNYPSEDKPFRILFSAAGMYYASDRDEVVCYSCGLRKAGWKETDIPIEVHKKIRPNCEFLVNNSAVNFPIPELERSQQLKFKTLDDLLNSNERPPTQQTEATGGSHGNCDLNTSQNPQYRFFVPPPKHPQYAIESVRLDTFKRWPTDVPQTPQIMAECGYYYAGFGDCVRCFHCGIGLRHWTEDDYPWIEHARWSKDCAYLQQIKGEEFIQNVHLAIDKDEEPEDLIPATASGQPADMSQVTPNDESNQILLTDPAQSVLEMRYQPRTIKKEIDIILRSEGRSGISAEKIMVTIFMLEERSDNKQRNTAKDQASNRNADHAQRSSEVRAHVQKGTYVKSEDKGHAKSDPKIPSNRVTKNEDVASPIPSPHSSLEKDYTYDGIILSSDEDLQSAEGRLGVIDLMRHLRENSRVPNLSLTTYQEFGQWVGRTVFYCTEYVKEHCRYIFVYVSENFIEDNLTRFQSQMCLYDVIQNNSWRVIPIFADRSDCPLELQLLHGLEIWNLSSPDMNLQNLVINKFDQIITDGRNRI